MPHDFNVQELGQRVLATTNEIFAAGEHNIRVQMLTAEDLEWCIVQTRQQPENQRIPWALSGAVLDNPDAFRFSFKILDADQRPAGACICQFCPATGKMPAVLNVEMLQNFHIQDSCLDGNTFRFALYAAVLFMVETQCVGLRLISPINARVADYYINEHHFIDITSGDNGILYRDAQALFQWFIEDSIRPDSSASVDAAQYLSDNDDLLTGL
ncbi:hypothetical protein [Serratia proteamaculans]|uniref:hypothetical protein n=1 Tax=Serratia proteamaculans TaxID=28151 RepID=UPI0039AF3097